MLLDKETRTVLSLESYYCYKCSVDVSQPNTVESSVTCWVRRCIH